MHIHDLVGNTPVVTLGDIYLKVEYMNPTGSHKDRIAMSMLEDAKNRGLKKGSSVIEYTSGNTGVSIAWASRFFGYKPTILVPQGTVREKISLIRGFGAEIIVVGAEEDGHILAENLAKEHEGLYLAQTKNLANFRAHYKGTGPELYSQTEKIDCFVMGAGTGGTIYGIGKFLKEKDEKIKVVLLVPKGSILQEELFGKREKDLPLLEGYSYHSFTDLLKRAFDEEIIDDVRIIDSTMTIEGTKELMRQGIPGGFTSGANYYQAMKISKEKGCKVATIVADSLIRYSSRMDFLL